MTVIELPVATRPLPGPADLARIMDLPIVQMFVVGRSGSTAVQAFLDGHPQILQIPQILQFYRLFGDGTWDRTPEKAIDWLLADSIVGWAMDSSQSLITKGSLGANSDTTIRIKRDEFRRAFLAAAGPGKLTERRLFAAFHVAHGWCQGLDLEQITTVFNHLHHGHWLLLDLLIERPAGTVYRADPVEPLVADRYVVTMRNPVTAVISSATYAKSAEVEPSRIVALYENLLRTIIQDWIRLAVLERQNRPIEILRLEDLKSDTGAALAKLAERLDIDADDPNLQSMTFFSLPWHGDVYSPRSTALRPEPMSATEDIHDVHFLYVLIGDIANRHGYSNDVGVFSADAATKYLEEKLIAAAGTESYETVSTRFNFGEAVVRQRQMLGI